MKGHRRKPSSESRMIVHTCSTVHVCVPLSVYKYVYYVKTFTFSSLPSSLSHPLPSLPTPFPLPFFPPFLLLFSSLSPPFSPPSHTLLPFPFSLPLSLPASFTEDILLSTADDDDELDDIESVADKSGKNTPSFCIYIYMYNAPLSQVN